MPWHSSVLANMPLLGRIRPIEYLFLNPIHNLDGISYMRMQHLYTNVFFINENIITAQMDRIMRMQLNRHYNDLSMSQDP